MGAMPIHSEREYDNVATFHFNYWYMHPHPVAVIVRAIHMHLAVLTVPILNNFKYYLDFAVTGNRSKKVSRRMDTLRGFGFFLFN